MILLYKKIKNHLVEKIERSKPGERLPSENELCQQFKVSRITVQRALKDLLEENAIVRKKGKGTFVPPSFVSHTSVSKKIRIIFPSGGDPEDDFLFPIMRGLLEHFQQDGFDFILTPRKLGNKRVNFSDVSGIFWIAPHERDFQVIEEISLKGVPLIVINRVMDNFINFVSTDHYKIGVIGTECLVSSGHNRIGFIGLIKGNTCSLQMYEGYCMVLKNSGIRISSNFVVPAYFNEKFEPDQRFYKKLNQFIEKHCPTGLFVAGELFLEHVLRVLGEKNLIPGKDIDVVITDEIPEKTLHRENITCIIQPLGEVGDIAARAMKQIIKGENKRIRVLLSPVIKPAKHSMQIFEKTERR